MTPYFPALFSLAFRAPTLLVWLTGAGVALVFWKRHKAVWALALIAFLGFLILDVVDVYLTFWLPQRVLGGGMSMARYSTILAAKGVLHSLTEFVLWIPVVVAIFGWRKTSDSESPAPH